MAIASHRKHFAIFVTQAKCDAILQYDVIMIWTNGFDFFLRYLNFLMRYYRNSFAIFFKIFDFFDKQAIHTF